MKSSLKTIGSLLALGLLTFSASAAVLLQENFDSYAPGPLTNQTAVWAAHSGTAPINIVTDPTGASGNALQVSQALAQDVHANLETNKTYADITITNTTFSTNGAVVTTNFIYSYAFSPSNSVSTLYSSYTIYVTSVPVGNSETYFGHFYVDSSTFKGRLFLVTNGVAVPGSFRIAIQNTGSSVTNTIPVDLSANTAYTLVTRYVLSTGSNTVWLNPKSETSITNATPLDAVSTGNILAYAFRQSAGEGIVDVDNLVTGTRFADVVPGSVNPPTILAQPQDTNVFSGASVVFNTLAVGDDTLGYQWFSITNGVTNGITGASGRTLTLSSLTTNQAGSIYCVVTNGAGTNLTRLAQLAVSAQPIPPTIDTNITPTGATNNVGDTVSFTVAAHGLPALAYQWKFVPATNSLVTNIVAGVNATGTNTATLTLANLTVNQSGSYFVTITNSSSVGYTQTNSASAVLTVVPPPFVSIATLRGMVDNTYAPTNTTAIYSIQGTVTTWANMTGSSANSEFYMQDASGGIVVFWSGASASTNLPPAGAIVKVTGPLAAFSGLLEIEPVFTNLLHSVTIISTNNPLPTPQPLPFDPNVAGNLATMKKLEGSYFVASNVMLNASTLAFVSGANDSITNNTTQTQTFTNSVLTLNFTNGTGQSFILFVNSQSGLPNQTKYTGPVTIYGVLGYFTSAGFEFTPSRFADIISYVHLTNVLTHARKGDLATNAYVENVVRPGESLKTYVSIGDAAGGSVTLTPTGPLPTGASWSGLVNGATATAVFQYAGNALDAGNNFPIQLAVTSTAGTSYTESFSVYVPTPQEQNIAITEFLAKPTTNPAAAFYNPLARASVINGISTNDQYVEIANQSAADLTSEFTLDTGLAAKPVFDSFDGFGTTLLSSNSLVVYGGNGNPSALPGLATPVSVSKGLFLPVTGSGMLVLRNSSGYIIDRVAYAAGDLSTNGSLSRFPAWTSGFVPQAYISTNLATAGLQYDGRAWNLAGKVPSGVAGIGITYVNGKAVLNFLANTQQASTLWNADNVTGPFTVIFGQPFPTGAGTFTNVNSASQQFYYITTQ